MAEDQSFAVVKGEDAHPTRFVKVLLQECESPANAVNAGVHTILREPQEIWMRDGVVVLVGAPGDTSTAIYIEGGRVR